LKPVLLVRLDGPKTDGDEAKVMRLVETLPGYKIYQIQGQYIFPAIGHNGGLASVRIAYLFNDDAKNFEEADLDAPDYIL
jgi:hypothetical protein